MKKLISLILVSLLVLTSFATVAFAAGNATLTVSNATAEAGDTVSVSFTLSGDQFAGYGMYITTDSALSVSGVEQGPASKGIFFFNPDKNNIVTCANWQNGEAGVLFTAKIKVAEGTKPGKYAVSVNIDNVADENDQDLSVSVVKGYVTVVCNHAWGDWTTVNAASCETEGLAERTCSKCGEKETKTLPAIGSHSFGQWVTVNEPTCTVAGKAERVCSVCGKTETKAVDATGIHVYGDWNVVTPATCTVDGKAERACACGKTESKAIAATGHAWGEWTTVTEASCETDGQAKRTCSKCGAEELKIIPAANAHTWGEWITVTEASCETDGLAKRVCSKCGKEENVVLKATGHKISSEFVTDGTNHWNVCENGCGEIFDMAKHELIWVITKNPGQNATGLKHQECKHCGVQVGEDVVIPAEPELDDVPQTSDPTMILTVSLMGFLSVLLVAAYVTKRKFFN